jgi:hypothetical protein
MGFPSFSWKIHPIEFIFLFSSEKPFFEPYYFRPFAYRDSLHFVAGALFPQSFNPKLQQLNMSFSKMNKQEASTITKKILTVCKLDSNSFILLEHNSEDTLSTGYKIRVKAIIDNECRRQIKRITKELDFAVMEEEDQILIYKPKPNSLNNLISE